MRRNAPVAVAALVATASLAGIIAIALHARGTSSTGRVPFGSVTRAGEPFATFDETRVAIDGRCERVLIARSQAQRVRGLRNVRDLGPYAGMLFVFPSDTSARFTMADTPAVLEMTWLDASGRPVDHTTMQPCPAGTDTTCPVYKSRGKYRYALERPAPAGGAGAVSSCA